MIINLNTGDGERKKIKKKQRQDEKHFKLFNDGGISGP